MRTLLACLALGLAAPGIAMAQERDPRIAEITPVGNAEIRLSAQPVTGLIVLLPPGERLEGADTFSPELVEVRTQRGLDRLLIMPRSLGDLGRITLHTNRTSYALSVATGEDDAPQVVRLVAPAGTELPPAQHHQPAWNAGTGGAEIEDYVMKGDRAVRPEAISHDGSHTYIRFAEKGPLPAVLELSATGEEQLLNSYYRDGRLVIDRVVEALVFRLDKAEAEARREPKESGDGR